MIKKIETKLYRCKENRVTCEKCPHSGKQRKKLPLFTEARRVLRKQRPGLTFPYYTFTVETCMKNGHNLEIMSLGTQDGMGLVTKSGETNEERKFKSREMLQSELDVKTREVERL